MGMYKYLISACLCGEYCRYDGGTFDYPHLRKLAEEGVEQAMTMLEDLQEKENCIRLRRLVKSCLTEQEEYIIRHRYGLDGETPKIQRDIAKMCGISRSYISRIEKRALQKLRKELDDEIL